MYLYSIVTLDSSSNLLQKFKEIEEKKPLCNSHENKIKLLL